MGPDHPETPIERFAHLFLSLDGPPGTGELPPGGTRDLAALLGLEKDSQAGGLDPSLCPGLPRYLEACAGMRRAVRDNMAMAMLAAPAKEGRALVIRLLGEMLAEDGFLVVEQKIEPGLGEAAFLKRVLFSLGVEEIYAGGHPPRFLMPLLRDRIIAMGGEKGSGLALLCDEAQFLTEGITRLLRSISNIGINWERPVAVLLFGDERLAGRLNGEDLAPIAGRVPARWVIGPARPGSAAVLAEDGS